MADVRVRVVVSGRVQGVFFRAETKRTAERLGLAGWVRNRSDGAVEAAFEGPRQAIEQAVAWCRIGPALAAVERVELAEEQPAGAKGFTISH